MATSAAWEKYSRLLEGEWLSPLLGYVKVGREGDAREYLVARGPQGQPLARLSPTQASGGGLRIVCEGSGLHIRGAGCSRRRIQWSDAPSARDVDSWDGLLIDVIREAASWVEKMHLRSDLHGGLAALTPSSAATSSERTVGLCMTMKNRLWQVERALPLNILHCWAHRHWVTIHLVDFGSSDSSLEWVLRTCRVAIDAGLLRVYSTGERMPHWHASIAKNTSHGLAEEDILVNVDCDNIVGLDFPVDVVRRMARDGFTALQYEEGDGTAGRVACWREQFLELNGYDEDCGPMGGQDIDLIRRLQMMSGARFQRVTHSPHGQAIPNTKALKIRNCDPAALEGCQSGGSPEAMMAKVWNRMNAKNSELFAQRRTSRRADNFLIGQHRAGSVGAKKSRCWMPNSIFARQERWAAQEERGPGHRHPSRADHPRRPILICRQVAT